MAILPMRLKIRSHNNLSPQKSHKFLATKILYCLTRKHLTNHFGICYDRSAMVKKSNNDDARSEVYILHFKIPYWNRARHYVGYTTIGAEKRIGLHRSGNGSLLVNYAHNKLSINFVVGLVEKYSCRKLARWRERQLKKEGHLARHCRICQRRAE